LQSQSHANDLPALLPQCPCGVKLAEGGAAAIVRAPHCRNRAHALKACAGSKRAPRFQRHPEQRYALEMRQLFTPAIRHSVRIFLLSGLCAIAAPAAADVLNYECIVGDVAIALHIDTDARAVRQVAREGSVTEIGQYSDGVYGPVSHAGAAALIPRVHQFVRIIDELVLYGAELHGVEDRAVLDRRLATITLANGKGGWCQEVK
jgi:hypothetical protein